MSSISNEEKRTIKCDLLCYGLRISPQTQEIIYNINPYICDKYVHGASFIIDNDLTVNTTFNEKYSKRSPYSVEHEGNNLFLIKNKNKVCSISIIEPPKWYEKKVTNGQQMHEVLSLHGNNVLSLSQYGGCIYDFQGKKCLFCSARRNSQLLNTSPLQRAKYINEVLSEALLENNNYALALSEGTKTGDDKGAIYFGKIVEEIRNKYQISISVELAPPNEIKYIEYLFNSGVSSIIMNIEVYDEKVRKVVCPGKSEINLEHYFDMLKYSVSKFGIGNVASVLIVGLEPVENTIKCSKELLSLGVKPILIPFKPYDNCKLSNHRTTDSKMYYKVSSEIDNEIDKLNFYPVSSFGCISCGACSSTCYQRLKRKL